MARSKPDAAQAPWRNRIVGSGVEAPDQLVANPGNWRTHPGEQRDALRGSLRVVGWVQQILVNQRTGHVVDGHARVEEALSRGELEVPVLYVDLSEEEEALVLATLDPIGAMAGTDQAQLGALLASISVDDAALERLLGDLGGPEGRRDGLTDPDVVPPLRPDPGVERGELWVLGDHRLFVGDATAAPDVARLLAGAAVDLVWTDPPYGVDYRGKTEERLEIRNDALSAAATRDLIVGALRLAPLRPGGVFYVAAPGGPGELAFLEALALVGWPLRQTIVWVKDRFVLGHSDFHYRHENVLTGEAPAATPARPLQTLLARTQAQVDDAPLVGDVGGKEYDAIAYGWAPGAAHRFLGGRKLDTVWEIPRPGASREHPTMKPVDLVARSLEYSTVRGERVYDPFAGSGTTLIAAEQLGRVGLAMELDAQYARVIIDRWEAFTGRPAERVAG